MAVVYLGCYVTSVLAIIWSGSFGKVCFDMLKSIEFKD